ncbi:ferredoxin [Pseudonocardia acidicola]|uniref:Ferredoxin n=1 Tax=Pseudonocardia acidicola TaxID=2724939 RepID=A0ABX1SHS9_9PSEU|nr:ferredoxin [Pseudonocardia acidicola]NMI01127.1 ferredoxin [Pseudonocardia acidicola]
MITIKVDRGVCQGYGNCVLADSATFDLDDEGLATLKAEQVGEDRLAAVRRAAYDCPTEAIALIESDPT